LLRSSSPSLLPSFLLSIINLFFSIPFLFCCFLNLSLTTTDRITLHNILIISYHIVLSCITLHNITYQIILYYIPSYHIISYCITLCHIVRCCSLTSDHSQEEGLKEETWTRSVILCLCYTYFTYCIYGTYSTHTYFFIYFYQNIT
jgi:hypothetical protein